MIRLLILALFSLVALSLAVPQDIRLPLVVKDSALPDRATITVGSGRLNVRSEPTTEGDNVIGSVLQGESYKVLEATADRSWIRIAVPGVLGGTGWIPVEFIIFSTPFPTLTKTPTETPTATGEATAMPTMTPTVTPTATQPAQGVCPCNADVRNCSDFTTQPQAQACHDFCEAQGAGDIHRLDGNDDDGQACESLPPFQVMSQPLLATQSQTTTVTIFAYDDTNENGWRDPNEEPYLPSYIGDIFCYDFRSPACDYEVGLYTCVSAAYTNTRVLPQACTFTVKRTTPSSIFDRDFGTLTTISDTMTIYFPLGSSAPDNLLGTATPTQTPSTTATRTSTATRTPTPTATQVPDSSQTPSPMPTSMQKTFLPSLDD